MVTKKAVIGVVADQAEARAARAEALGDLTSAEEIEADAAEDAPAEPAETPEAEAEPGRR